MHLEPWQWLLANFGFPVVMTLIIFYFYWRKDENSVPKDVYEAARIRAEKIDELIEYVEDILTDMRQTTNQILETSAMNTQALTALRETVGNLCHLIDILLVIKGAGKDKNGPKRDS